MRVRSGILVLVLAAGLTACGGSSSPSASGSTTPTDAASRLSTPSAPLTNVVIPCVKFQDAARKIATAEGNLYGGKGGVATLDALAAELNALKNGAPSDVQAALDDLVSAFRSAASVIKYPTAPGQASLAALGKRLSDDSKKVTAYVISKCTGG